ncbi:MAG: CotH kinase family protein [Oscillospiraceae bacterium]|nr:CotH kinase family protein [Oscillospiraceae bacterium]
MNIKKLSAFAIAAVLAASMLCSCAQIEGNKDDVETGSQTTPVSSSEPEVTTTEDPNIPSNIITTTTPEVTTATPAPTSSESETSETSQTLASDEETTPAQTSETSKVELPSTTPAVTNPEGEIVDDYKQDIEFNTEDPDELYEMFGLSRSDRESYYAEISQEHEFPIVHISTEDEQNIVSREEYLNCLVEIFNCEEKYVMDATSAGIRVRGNASAHYGNVSQILKEGAPYRIKFTEKQSVLGLNDGARCKSWVLLRTFSTGIRDYLAYDIARTVNDGDYYVTDAQFVQVYVNEEYKGIYVLCEQTQANPNRVDLNEADEGYTGTDIGYLVELDNYATSEDRWFWLNFNKEEITDVYGETRVPRKYHYSVKNDLYSDEQLKYIERYMEVCWEIPMRAIKYGEYYKVDENFNLVLAQEEFASAYDCISQVIDIQSVLDMYMVFEICNDQDLGGGSFFFAVDFGEHPTYPVLTCVAPWDFDWGYTDYSSDADGGLYAAAFKDDYFVDNWGDRSNPWLILFYSADWFQDLVKEKWREKYPEIKATVDECYELVTNNKIDFNYDGESRTRRALANLDWVYERLEYLNEIWG